MLVALVVDVAIVDDDCVAVSYCEFLVRRRLDLSLNSSWMESMALLQQHHWRQKTTAAKCSLSARVVKSCGSLVVLVVVVAAGAAASRMPPFSRLEAQ